ncbi:MULTISPECIES: xanthine dehydrogenase family protein molybdopterin-binding subunit [unclassified Curtobacterium]|uniref:xanthine dehydrogenase family protein molybdopterin-binding subunit n=1 Tax=unclassified Curtobacterium TaxID=257496 RepID=UPI0021ABB5EF|nr:MULTISPECIES: xanthine dehydrogenase family protein molybdopterin-binding subunit [unclassified Curtobacterium]
MRASGSSRRPGDRPTTVDASPAGASCPGVEGFEIAAQVVVDEAVRMESVDEQRRGPVLGAPLPRVEGADKVRGRARYAAETGGEDVACYAWVVQAAIARGRVVAIDREAVLAMPGVVTVIAADDAPRLTAVPTTELFVLQSDRVHYRGEPVALVVAETFETARAAAAALRVTYDAEPADTVFPDEPSFGPDDAPGVFVAPESINGDLEPDTDQGDLDRALADADVVLDATYTTPPQVNNPLEPHAATAWWVGPSREQDEDGRPRAAAGARLELIEATQGPSLAAGVVADLFGIDDSAVRLRTEHVGGGFGSKGSPKPDVPLATMAALVTGRRVKLVFTRQMVFSIGGYRTPTASRIRLGARPDGTLTAIGHDVRTQTSTIGTFVEQVADCTRHVYAAPNRRTSHRYVALDVPTPRFMRAPGEAPGSFALESGMDELAAALGIDPVELRLRNEPDVDPIDGAAFSTRNLVGCLRRGAELFGWEARGREPRMRRDGRWLVGAGVAAAYYPARVVPSGATVTAEADGTFTVGVAASDIGTGSRTVLLQVAADALEVGVDRIRMHIADSTLPQAALGAGSFGTTSWGWAVDKTCRSLRERLERGAVVPSSGLSVTERTDDDVQHLAERSRHAYGAQFVEVSVDTDSGEVRVDRMVGVFAAGRIYNARTARAQLVGGMTWGIGMALHEDAEIDPVAGDIGNHDLATYHVATNADVESIHAEWLDEPGEDLTPLGGKGIGEIGIVGAAAALANAVWDATGVRVRRLPIRPDALVDRMPARA